MKILRRIPLLLLVVPHLAASAANPLMAQKVVAQSVTLGGRDSASGNRKVTTQRSSIAPLTGSIR